MTAILRWDGRAYGGWQGGISDFPHCPTPFFTEQRPGQKPVADKEAGAVSADKTVTRESQELGFRLEAAVGRPTSQSPAASASRLYKDLD